MVGLMGPAGAGQLTKMVNQICIAGLVQGLAEGIHFAKRCRPRRREGRRRHFQGRRPVLADGEPLQDHECRQIRFRLCRRLDAQGSRHLPRPRRAATAPSCRSRRWSTSSMAMSRRWAAAAGTRSQPDRQAGTEMTDGQAVPVAEVLAELRGLRVGGTAGRHGAFRHQHRDRPLASRWRRMRPIAKLLKRRPRAGRSPCGRAASTRPACSPR